MDDGCSLWYPREIVGRACVGRCISDVRLWSAKGGLLMSGCVASTTSSH